MIVRITVFQCSMIVVYAAWKIGSFQVREQPSISSSSNVENNPKLIRRLRDSVAPWDKSRAQTHAQSDYSSWSFGSHVDAGYEYDAGEVNRRRMGNGRGYDNGFQSIAAPFVDFIGGPSVNLAAGLANVHRGNAARYETDPLRRLADSTGYITSLLREILPYSALLSLRDSITAAFRPAISDLPRDWVIQPPSTMAPWTMDEVARKFQEWFVADNAVLSNNTNVFSNTSIEEKTNGNITGIGAEVKQLDEPIADGATHATTTAAAAATPYEQPSTPTEKPFGKKNKDSPLTDKGDAAFTKSIREVLIEKILNRKARTTTAPPPDYIKSGRALLQRHANAQALDEATRIGDDKGAPHGDQPDDDQWNGRIQRTKTVDRDDDRHHQAKATPSPLEEAMRRFVDSFDVPTSAPIDGPLNDHEQDDEMTWANAIDDDPDEYDYPLYTYGTAGRSSELSGDELHRLVAGVLDEDAEKLEFYVDQDEWPTFVNATVSHEQEKALLTRQVQSLQSFNRTRSPQSVVKQIQLTLLHNSGLSDDVKKRLRAFLPTSRESTTEFSLNGTTAVRPAPIIKSLMAGDMVEQRLEEIGKEIDQVKKKHGANKPKRVKNEIDKFLSQRLYNPDLVGGGRNFVPGDEFELERLQRQAEDKEKKKKGIKVKAIDFKAEPKVLKAYFKPKLLEAKGSISFMRALWQPQVLYANAEPKLLAPTFYANLLNMEAKPALLVAQFKPKLLSPEIFASLLSLEWRGEMLRATFDPKLLSPEINMQLLRINAETPRLLTSENEPKLLSPEIDLQLLLIDPQVELLTQEFRPKLLSPTIKIHLLRVNPTATALTIVNQPSLLSPTITLALGK